MATSSGPYGVSHTALYTLPNSPDPILFFKLQLNVMCAQGKWREVEIGGRRGETEGKRWKGREGRDERGGRGVKGWVGRDGWEGRRGEGRGWMGGEGGE